MVMRHSLTDQSEQLKADLSDILMLLLKLAATMILKPGHADILTAAKPIWPWVCLLTDTIYYW